MVLIRNDYVKREIGGEYFVNNELDFIFILLFDDFLM